MIYNYFDTVKKRVISSNRELQESDSLVKLNAEQVSFFNTHRRSSYDEIWNAQEYVPPTPEPVPEPTLEELKVKYLKELSDLSLEILGSHVSEYQLVNARLSLDAVDYDKIYDDDKSQDIIDVYLEVGRQCRTLYYEAKEAIEACKDVATLNTLKDDYDERYEQKRKD